MIELNTSSRDNVAIVGIAGRIIYETENEFRNTILGLIDEDKINIVLVLEKLSYINSSGLGILINLLKIAQKKGGDIKLTKLQGEIRELFSITSLDQVFSIYDDFDEAIESYS
ncbi:STAS domain-containing protein [bacterium]|nr:STAS domain-containing protein [bacterium]